MWSDSLLLLLVIIHKQVLSGTIVAAIAPHKTMRTLSANNENLLYSGSLTKCDRREIIMSNSVMIFEGNNVEVFELNGQVLFKRSRLTTASFLYWNKGRWSLVWLRQKRHSLQN